MYGIDVSTYQRNLNMAVVQQQGNEFVGVKAVAASAKQLARAADYENNVDRVMATSMRKYHYTTINSENTPEATAAFMVSNTYRRHATDRWMLDNEPLDTYKVFWNDEFVFRFWSEMAKLGVPPTQGIQYCPAALTRSQSWPRLKALREQGLAIQWVSYGDMDPYYEDGEEPFTGNTGLDNPEMHQFTSSYTVPGYSALIDRVYSRLTIGQLFGGGSMPRTYAGMVAWSRNEAANGNVRKAWGGWCEAFINWGGAFNQNFRTALAAGNASGPMRGDYENAGRGAIIYWSGVWIDGEENGHVAWVYEPGPDPLLLMASNAAQFPAWGYGIGLIRLSQYQRLFGHPLRGWTYRHGTETLDLSGTSGGGVKPIVEEEDDMLFMAAAGEGRPAITLSSGRVYPIPLPHIEIVKGTCTKVITEVNAAQYDIIRAAWLQGEYVATPATVDLSQIKLPTPAPAEVDYAKIAETTADEADRRAAKRLLQVTDA